MHHEYAGLAGVELAKGADSDYFFSDQITSKLVYESVLRLPVTSVLSVTDKDHRVLSGLPECDTTNEINVNCQYSEKTTEEMVDMMMQVNPHGIRRLNRRLYDAYFNFDVREPTVTRIGFRTLPNGKILVTNRYVIIAIDGDDILNGDKDNNAGSIKWTVTETVEASPQMTTAFHYKNSYQCISDKIQGTCDTRKAYFEKLEFRIDRNLHRR